MQITNDMGKEHGNIIPSSSKHNNFKEWMVWQHVWNDPNNIFTKAQ